MALVDMGLYNPDGTEATPVSGPFGVFATGPTRVAERVLYELSLDAGAVTGRTTGPGIGTVVTGAATTIDTVTAFQMAATAVLARLGAATTSTTAPGDVVRAIGLVKISVAEGVVTFVVRVVTDDATVSTGLLTVNPPAWNL